MKIQDYSHRHGKELTIMNHPDEYDEINGILKALDPFPHGLKKNFTPKKIISQEFHKKGWDTETKIRMGTEKRDYCDIWKNGVYIEQEYSRFEMFFRDFFRFMLLYDERELGVGVIITYSDEAYKRWGSGVKSYPAARASLSRLIEFLKGKYSAVVRVPIWCIGIE